MTQAEEEEEAVSSSTVDDSEEEGDQESLIQPLSSTEQDPEVRTTPQVPTLTLKILLFVVVVIVFIWTVYSHHLISY